MHPVSPNFIFFFFNDTATTEIYTLSLHDALPIYTYRGESLPLTQTSKRTWRTVFIVSWKNAVRSEEHTSELQSRSDLVCRLLLEKKKKNKKRASDKIRTHTMITQTNEEFLTCR